jgi:hypothetical protein
MVGYGAEVEQIPCQGRFLMHCDGGLGLLHATLAPGPAKNDLLKFAISIT